ncbi:superoxide dismutase [Candidatus Azambacteria bacterium]|nr:superoxide dismutase [Candidatus Azambacteria bacterium]
MPYEPKNFEHLLGMNGLSEKLLKDHFTLYQGYVANFNKLDQILQGMEKEGRFGVPEYAELNRRLGWEFNGMRLHELYFGNLTKTPMALDAQSALAAAIAKEFGSYEMWEKDFKAMGAMRGIGWVVLYYDASAGRLFNIWVNEHDVGHLAGATPLLVMDMFEHAHIADYGLNRKEYIEKRTAAWDWAVVARCFSDAA